MNPAAPVRSTLMPPPSPSRAVARPRLSRDPGDASRVLPHGPVVREVVVQRVEPGREGVVKMRAARSATRAKDADTVDRARSGHHVHTIRNSGLGAHTIIRS